MEFFTFFKQFSVILEFFMYVSQIFEIASAHFQLVVTISNKYYNITTSVLEIWGKNLILRDVVTREETVL